jgi:hypothetical protein
LAFAVVQQRGNKFKHYIYSVNPKLPAFFFLYCFDGSSNIHVSIKKPALFINYINMRMKFLVCALMLFSFKFVSAQQLKLNYDGFYSTLPDSLNPFRYYLRFYPDSTVIGYSTAGNPKNLVSWFSKDHKSPSRGQYSMKDSLLTFSLKSEEGNVLYDGAIHQGDHLLFSVKSMINQYEGKEEYFFMKMEGLK